MLFRIAEMGSVWAYRGVCEAVISWRWGFGVSKAYQILHYSDNMFFPILHKFLIVRLLIVEKYDFRHFLAYDGEDKQPVEGAKHFFRSNRLDFARFYFFEHRLV